MVAGNLEAGEGRIADADSQVAVASQPSRSGINASSRLSRRVASICEIRVRRRGACGYRLFRIEGLAWGQSGPSSLATALMALGVIPSGFPPRKIRHRGQQQNRDDAHQVDPEPAGFARRHGADTSALERGRDAPSSLAEARRYYGAAHSAAVKRRPRGRAKRHCRTCRPRSEPCSKSGRWAL